MNHNPLCTDSITTKVTKTASFQETIAKPGGAEDLLRIIRATQSEQYALVERSRDNLVSAIGNLLDQLHQDDFELLVDLIFSSSGWKRISRVGGPQKTLDLALLLPTTNERAFVQIKSETNHKIFQEYIEALDNSENYDRLFFVYHTPKEAFTNMVPDRVNVWNREEIARQAVRAGLVDWILGHTT